MRDLASGPCESGIGKSMKKVYTENRGYTKSGYIFGVVLNALAGMCILFVLLTTALQIVCYSDMDMYRKEYEKYGVLNYMPAGTTMSEEDGLMAVTKHMMKYLIGDKDTPDLQIRIKTDAGMRDFFNERELIHMKDVRDLFLKGMQFRYIALMFALFVFVYCRFGIFREKKAFLKATGKGLLIGTAAFFGIMLILSVIFMVDFNSAFITFHKIFFDNDYWLLDPRTSLLINILPEGFFFDIVKKVLILFLPSAAVVVVIAFLINRKYKNAELTFRKD